MKIYFLNKKARKISNIIFVCLVIFLSSFTLVSCFTGIESTKKINLSRDDKRRADPTPEERFMDQLESYPLKSWERGKQFIVSDDRAMLVIVPQRGLVATAPDSIKGKTLEFTGVESKINAAGAFTVTILFTDGIYIYAYDTGKEFQEAMEDVKSSQIPMLIDQQMVDEARQLLSGKKFWTRSNLWYDKDGDRIDGKKFVEITIVDVQPGNMIFPLQLQILSDSNQTAYMYMNYGSDDNESRAFHNLFSISDIRKHYPNIEPETWDYISEGKVKIGMTKDECRLALGNPAELNSGHDYSQTLDIWAYENGRVLWFEDGRLIKIRQ